MEIGGFGGASYYEAEDLQMHNALEHLEVRAFGCLIEDLLVLSKEDKKNEEIKDALLKLQISCLDKIPNKRPLFKQILEQLNKIVYPS